MIMIIFSQGSQQARNLERIRIDQLENREALGQASMSSGSGARADGNLSTYMSPFPTEVANPI